MLTSPTPEQLEDQLCAFAAFVTEPLPPESETGAHIGQSDVRISLPEVRRVAAGLARHSRTHRSTQDILACTIITIVESQCLSFVPSLGPEKDRELRASAALVVAEIQARAGGMRLEENMQWQELFMVLCDPVPPLRERREEVVSLCQRAQRFLRDTLRPRPPGLKPIIYIGTGISDVKTLTHREIMRDAELVAGIAEEYGYEVDVPGRYVTPDRSFNTDFQARDAQADSALTYTSAFIGVRYELGRRGMGYAVRRVEDVGAPVLLLTKEAGHFARVYRGSLRHRDEELYESDAELEAFVRTFFDGASAQIEQRQADVLRARQHRSYIEQLQRRLDLVEPATFRSRRLRHEQAVFLLSDPVHLFHAQRWELQDLSAVLGAPLAELQAWPTSIPATVAGGSQPPVSHQSSRQPLLTRLSWQGLKPAREAGGWPFEHMLVLINDFMEQPLAEQVKMRNTHVSAEDWDKWHQRRFQR